MVEKTCECIIKNKECGIKATYEVKHYDRDTIFLVCDKCIKGYQWTNQNKLDNIEPFIIKKL